MRWLLIPVLTWSVACSDTADPYVPPAGDQPGGDHAAAGDSQSGDPSAGDPQGGDPAPGGDPGPADLAASFLYINQRMFREDDAFAQGGTARLELFAPQALPADTRTAWTNDDGERCTYEYYTEWPWEYPSGTTWPEGPFHDAGDIQLQATGAPGPVVYAWFDSYYVRDSPDAVQQGGFTHSSFFPPEYIPHGATATINAAGGSDVGSFTMTGASLAADYSVSSPDIVAGTDVIDTTAAMTFSWSPAAPGDTMSVIVKDSMAYLKCVFDDDGEATVPAAAMATLTAGQFIRFTVQTWREHRSGARVVATDGTTLDVEFVSRHVHIGRFDSQ